ncbi:MAG: hypothetical protein ACSLE8_21165 [Rhodococcus sp. (in: high G+C Gram-positive bacteria)]
MTALIYLIQDDQVCIAADTLVHENHAPRSYVTKILTLPHLRGAIAGTGSCELLLQWYVTLQRSILPNLTSVTEHAPKQLRDFARTQPPTSTTIYHFAWNEKRFEGVSFSSRDDYAPKPLVRNSIVIKPEYEGVHEDGGLIYQGAAGFAEFIRRQRAFDEQLPVTDRAEIGGEVHVVSITPERMFQTIAYRFPDYDELYQRMCHRLACNAAAPPADGC